LCGKESKRRKQRHEQVETKEEKGSEGTFTSQEGIAQNCAHNIAGVA
jgi:hypothetical protein